MKVACTLVQVELYTVLPEAIANKVLKLPVVIDWLTAKVLLPAGAVTFTQ